jgi:hypothetical protein
MVAAATRALDAKRRDGKGGRTTPERAASAPKGMEAGANAATGPWNGASAKIVLGAPTAPPALLRRARRGLHLVRPRLRLRTTATSGPSSTEARPHGCARARVEHDHDRPRRPWSSLMMRGDTTQA